MSGGGEARKTPFAKSIDRFTRGKIDKALGQLGFALPCHVEAISGSIVTVAFDVQGPYTLPMVQLPVFGPEYIRYPIQVQSKGVCFPVDVRIGDVTGLGSGVPQIDETPGNLSSLVFFPVGNTSFFPVDPNFLVLYGPDGVVIMDAGKNTVITVSKSGTDIELTGGGTVTVNNGNVKVNNGNVIVNSGDVIADGISLKHHEHPTGFVQTGQSVPAIPPVPLPS
jgi:hypothetical protein